MSLTRSRPSPAMIVAVLALTLALAGSAIAAPDASLTALSKAQVKRIAKKVANKQITKRAPGLSVAHAKTADNATNAQNATNATNATNITGANSKNLPIAYGTATGGVTAVTGVGGTRTTSAASSGTGFRTITFTGNFSGITANSITFVVNTPDSDAFTTCSGDNDTTTVTATTLEIEVFCFTTTNAATRNDPASVVVYSSDG